MPLRHVSFARCLKSNMDEIEEAHGALLGRSLSMARRASVGNAVFALPQLTHPLRANELGWAAQHGLPPAFERRKRIADFGDHLLGRLRVEEDDIRGIAYRETVVPEVEQLCRALGEHGEAFPQRCRMPHL